MDRPFLTSYEAGLSCYPDLDGAHPDARLGLDLSTLVSNVVPGGGIVTNASQLFQSITGGAQTDAGRNARVQWTVDAAKRGSVLAAEIIIAAPDNVGGNERAMWTSAISQVPASVLNKAYELSPSGWWPTGQPDFYTDTNGPTHQRIVQEVNAANRAAVVVGDVASDVVSAVTQHSSTVVPLLILGGGAVALAMLSKRRRV